MLKGVNKQVLEITSTQSPYFERIIFFVRPNQQNAGEGILKTEAERLAAKANRPPVSRKTAKQRWQAAATVLLGAGAGAALMFLLQYMV